MVEDTKVENGHETESSVSNEERDTRESSQKRPSESPESSSCSSKRTKPTINVKEPAPGQVVRVYTDGVYDLFHYGHMRQLEQAKKYFPNTHLIVGVASNEETLELKGLTVLDLKERAETVRHCRWVDEVIEDAPWIINEEFLAKHKIDYVAQNPAPYPCGDIEDIYLPLKESGRFIPTDRTDTISTSDVITRIIKNYNMYALRNLSRGIDRRDLNISLLKQRELVLRQQLHTIRNIIKENFFSKQQHNDELTQSNNTNSDDSDSADQLQRPGMLQTMFEWLTGKQNL